MCAPLLATRCGAVRLASRWPPTGHRGRGSMTCPRGSAPSACPAEPKVPFLAEVVAKTGSGWCWTSGLRRRLDAADQQFELSDLVLECGLAGLGEGDPGAGALSCVALLYGDEPGGFQHAKVLGQVACGQPERVAQVAELHPAGLMGDGEDAQPHPLIDDVIERVRGMSGHAARPGRWARRKPMPPSSSTLPGIPSCIGKPSHPWPLTEPTVAVTSTTAKYPSARVSSASLRSAHDRTTRARPI